MRIIGGKYKGKKLFAFDYSNIRPTSDNVKEAIFNTIQTDINNGVFLDLFGGTGSVGLEALSRGAKKVYICDNNFDSINLIKKNNSLFTEKVEIIFLDYKKSLKYFKEKNIKFDIIFLDPPYDTELGEDAIKLIYEYKLLQKDGLIIFEYHKNKTYTVLEGLSVIKEKKYGIKKVTYLTYEAAND